MDIINKYKVSYEYELVSDNGIVRSGNKWFEK